MSALLDCRSVAKHFFVWVAEEKTRLKLEPCLATILHSPQTQAGSVQYRDLILKDAQRLGIRTETYEPENEADFVNLIQSLNAKRDITGILILYPLGFETPDEDLMDLVDPFKDVEGLHSINLGYLIKYKQLLDEAKGIKCVVPATAKAVVKTLQQHEVPISGALVTIVNNSMRVGKPLGLMLENLGATVIKCYDRTNPKVLQEAVSRADILVTAVPDPKFSLKTDWVKPGAVVVDISFQGNVDATKLAQKAAKMTSPENRIGQVTRAMTFVNLIYCTQNQQSIL